MNSILGDASTKGSSVKSKNHDLKTSKNVAETSNQLKYMDELNMSDCDDNEESL